MLLPSQPSKERVTALNALLAQYGPYRRDQLRLSLLSAAEQARDEADHLRRHNSAFTRATGRPPLPLMAPARSPRTPDDFEAEAAQLEHGPRALKDVELLAQLLGGTGPEARAQQLLDSFGSLRSLLCEDAAILEHHPALGKSGAANLIAAVELGRRLRELPEARPRLRSPKDIHGYLAPKLEVLRREAFHVLCLDSRNFLIKDARIAEGTQRFCLVDPREVFTVALASRATGVVLAHNHPAGNPGASESDIALTRELAHGARLLGIELVDHVIIGQGCFHSMREAGQLPRLESPGGGTATH